MKRCFSNCFRLISLLLTLLSFRAEAQEVKNGLTDVAVNYYIEHVWDPANLNWQIFSVETGWRAGALQDGVSAVLIPRLNMGERTGNGVSLFTNSALQGQLDAFLILSHRINIFANYGYSGSSVFARHQGALELNSMLDKGWGVTAGVKVTRWDNTAIAYVLGAEKYLGKFWVTLRPMLVVQQGKLFPAVRGGIRYYITDAGAYLHFGLSYGNSPEYATYRPDLSNMLSLGSFGGYLNWKQPLSKRFILGLSVSYRREEYKDHVWRNVLGAHTGLTFKF